MMLRPEKARRGFGPLGPLNSEIADGRLAPGARTTVSDTLAPSEFEVCPGHDDDGDGEEHHGRGREALAEILRLEHVVVDVFCRHLRRDAGTARGLGDDEVVDTDNAAGDDDER